jgi:hypothetical protein
VRIYVYLTRTSFLLDCSFSGAVGVFAEICFYRYPDLQQQSDRSAQRTHKRRGQPASAEFLWANKNSHSPRFGHKKAAIGNKFNGTQARDF